MLPLALASLGGGGAGIGSGLPGSSSSTGPVTTGPVSIGGIDFAPSASEQLGVLAIAGAALLAAVVIATRRGR